MKRLLQGYLVIIFVLSNSINLKGQDNQKISHLRKGTAEWQEPVIRISSLLAISKEFEGFALDSSLKYSILANELSIKYKEKEGRVNSLVQLGRIYLLKGKFDSAIESSELAIELAGENGMKNEEATANGVLAIIMAEIGDYDKSANYNFTALRLFEETGNTIEIGITAGNIAADMLSLKNYAKALTYMQKSLDIAIKLDDKPGIAQQYNNIAGVHFTGTKNYRKALLYYRKSLQVNQQLKDELQAGVNFLNIGHCYLKLHINDSTLFFLYKAMDIFTRSGNSRMIANGELALAKYYAQEKDQKHSLEHSLRAYELGVDSKSMEILAEASENVYRTYLQRGDTIKAFRFAALNFAMKDSLQAMQSEKTLFKLEYQYNYEKKDKEKQLKAQRNYYIMGFIILGLLSSTSIVLLFYSRQKIKMRNTELQKDKIAADLNFKNKELTINLMALMKKNELLADLSKKLLKLEKVEPGEELARSIKQVNKELKQTTDDKIWKEFSLRFNQLNSEFYESLTSKFPDLTQNELKLCAYLRLNMTSKEISELTGQRILTLENARYRLRKKLGITGSDTNLVNFLSHL